MRVSKVRRLVVLLIALSVTTVEAQKSDGEQTQSDVKVAQARQIDDLISRMTLEEKVRMGFGGTRPGVVVLPGVPRLRIPSINPVDGPRGITATHAATAFPAGVGLASSWNPGLLKDVGEVVGEEARANGKTMVLGPAINIDRDPLDGRFFEYLTEDPYLDGQLSVGFIQGVQSRRVAAVVKHLCCNNREWNRDWYMSNVSERVLQEIYLPGFEASIKAGNAWGVMTAANGINGHLAATNHYLLTDVLRNQWGFKGLVLTDFNQARNTLQAALAGLDIGMPWGDWNTTPFGKPLMDAVKKGEISQSLIDTKVRHILWVDAKIGLLDGVPAAVGGATNTPEHQAVALRAAEESLVLLKNERNLLPLDASKIKRIVVIGPNADRKLCKPGYGGSSAVPAAFEITPLEGLRRRLASKAKVEYIDYEEGGDFEPIAPEYWQPINGARGMTAEYFNDGEEHAALTRVEQQVNFTWQMSSPDPSRIHGDNFHANFKGKLVPTRSGYYTFRLTGEDTNALIVDGNPLIRNGEKGHVQTGTAITYLQAGKSYNVEINYHAFAGDASLRLEWIVPRTEAHRQEELARLQSSVSTADAVVFVGGWGHGLDTEGEDRQNMDFPKDQEELIRTIAKMNPHTIVVLVHGSPFTVGGWIDSVPSVLDAFYPGMEGGAAIAEVLFGDINPSGKLSFTWPKQLSDSAPHALASEDHDNVNYKEGLFVGYRYATAYHVTPQFPFGFGLSYTQFSFGDLKVSKEPGTADATVAFTVTNTGKRAGAEVAQVYLGFPPVAEGNEPPIQLKGFRKVMLNPGQSKTVELKLDKRSFSYWSAKTHGWQMARGDYQIIVGDSSVSTSLRTRLTVR